MQTKRQMLASDRARASYVKFQRQCVAATVCRGTTGDDFNFFYSVDAYWSHSCLGWVPDIANKSKICCYCAVTKPPVREFYIKEEDNDHRTESRDSDRLHGQVNEPSKSRRSRLHEVQTSSKHRDKGNKSLPKNKIKENSKRTVQKVNKKTKS